MSSLSINMIFSYLSNQAHRTKINECFSERSTIKHGVAQGSVDLFNECEESLYYRLTV